MVKKSFVALLVGAIFSFNTSAWAALPLKATLAKNDQGWCLVDFNHKSGNVDLNAQSWCGAVPSEKQCYRGIFGITNGDCEDLAFVSHVPSGGNIISVPIMWPLGLVFGTVSLLKGDPDSSFIFPIMVNAKYDQADFKEALQEAYQNAGGEENFQNLLSRYQALTAAAEQANAEFAQLDETSGCQQRATAAVSDYQKDLEQIARSAFRVKVKDESGFWPGGKSLEAGDNFRFQPKSLELPEFVAPSYQGYLDITSAVEKELIPVETVQAFAQKLESGDALIEKLRAENTKLAESNRSESDRVRNENEAILAKFATVLKQKSGQAAIVDAGSLEKNLDAQGFVYDMKVPVALVVKNGKAAAGDEAILKIKGRNFYDVLPQTYSFRNGDLEVKLVSGDLKVTNKTKSYVSLDALTLYHEEDVLSLGDGYLREIPPNTIITISLRSFGLGTLKDDYAALTRAGAKRTTVSFGFACKYRRNDLTQARSFVEVKHYNLLDILSAGQHVAAL